MDIYNKRLIKLKMHITKYAFSFYKFSSSKIIRKIKNEKVLKQNCLTNKQEEIYKVVKKSTVQNPVCIHYIGKNKTFSIDNYYDEEYRHLYYYYSLAKEKIGK